jgi:hypothetical protein
VTVLRRDDERPETAGAFDDLVLIEGEWVRRAVTRRDAAGASSDEGGAYS